MILLVFLRRPVLLRVLWRCATTSFVFRAGAPAAGHRPRHSFRQNQLKAADSNLAYHEQMYRTAQSNPEQLEALNKTKVELQNARNKIAEALNASVLEISQSGLWHLAAQDPSLRTRLEQRMQDMKTLLLEEVKTKLYGKLRETANGIVKDIIQREIAERVRQQVGQVPTSKPEMPDTDGMTIAVRTDTTEASR